MDCATLKEVILERVREYARLTHGQFAPDSEVKFVSYEPEIYYAGRVFDGDEVAVLVESSLDFWLTLGSKGEKFQFIQVLLWGCSIMLLSEYILL